MAERVRRENAFEAIDAHPAMETPHHAGVVDQHIETLAGRAHSSAERPDGCQVREIQPLEADFGARRVRANPPHRFLAPRLVARCDRHVRARARQGERVLIAQTAPVIFRITIPPRYEHPATVLCRDVSSGPVGNFRLGATARSGGRAACDQAG
ncbi:hypothetical protein MESS4_610064 [Mesorhizobium sp. STM 4661]|nr:hypothetical protein MESS4_610064 [Mesorhizobium sp. STM 4661]